MSPLRLGRKSRRDAEADDSYQLDAVVSLFAMILVILVTTAAASAIGTTRFAYRSEDPQTAPVQPESLAAPFPRLETWILRQGALMRLDYDAAARLLAENIARDPMAATDPATGIDLTLIPSPTEPGAFDTFEVLLPPGPIPAPGGVIAAIVDPADGDAVAAWARGAQPARIAVFGSGVTDLPALSAAAEAAGRPVTVLFLTGNQKFAERRTSASFGFRGVLRSY
ncbi:hypothetical protein [Maliponia aquimaris]|uniref:Uncharacterized protein n=1 Tax=Maliponia aquimaris TaxID=1673631 RepID=A0A238KGF2_9RHOB|nr:hypothetical protein [Maliponia aquimaris]SMX41949.1 hypothetical protein MAA8898_02492 [Maliponia aquimaris]